MAFRTPGLFERIRSVRKVQEQTIRACRAYTPQIVVGPVSSVSAPIKNLSPGSPDVTEPVSPQSIHIDVKTPSEVVLKGDGSFNIQCLEASKVCTRLCRRYALLVTIMQFLSGAMATVCCFIALWDLWWGIGIALFSSVLNIAPRIFGWSKLEEKYASLSHMFIRLIHNPGPDVVTRFAEYKMFMESCVLEADLL